MGGSPRPRDLIGEDVVAGGRVANLQGVRERAVQLLEQRALAARARVPSLGRAKLCVVTESSENRGLVCVAVAGSSLDGKQAGECSLVKSNLVYGTGASDSMLGSLCMLGDHDYDYLRYFWGIGRRVKAVIVASAVQPGGLG